MKLNIKAYEAKADFNSSLMLIYVKYNEKAFIQFQGDLLKLIMKLSTFNVYHKNSLLWHSADTCGIHTIKNPPITIKC
ncbi:CLUMA_CG004906, isoform A [Clunio marinus]|uniref:CLUMA_CG004906, isoform A n=1 Tax=Clunio marinus TaxID=568069 RepID=A0A1J1HT30_9DIPT|nr:CLUMA_CG004906, isoform A [Clunio marinus]